MKNDIFQSVRSDIRLKEKNESSGETTAAFEFLENTQILTNRKRGGGIIVTLAKNGGLQIKSRL